MAGYTGKIADAAVKKGFDTHKFKVGWYNDLVDERFRLPYDYHTLAVILVSTPDMFELNFVPYLRQHGWTEDTRDPLDQSVSEFVTHLKQTVIGDEKMDVLYDYELDPRTKRPRILVQTAGHAAGAAFFYQQHHLSGYKEDSVPSEKLFGVSIHSVYGGWFAFRAVLILPEQSLPAQLSMVEPADVIPKVEDRFELLKLFNHHWRDNRFRDVITPKTRYSDLQKEYFNTPPKDRKCIIQRIQSDDT